VKSALAQDSPQIASHEITYDSLMQSDRGARGIFLKYARTQPPAGKILSDYWTRYLKTHEEKLTPAQIEVLKDYLAAISDKPGIEFHTIEENGRITQWVTVAARKDDDPKTAGREAKAEMKKLEASGRKAFGQKAATALFTLSGILQSAYLPEAAP
jgi:hypothetical protein